MIGDNTSDLTRHSDALTRTTEHSIKEHIVEKFEF